MSEDTDLDPDRQTLDERDAASLTIFDRLAQGLTVNQEYLDRATSTSAQNVAQVRALTRQVNALLRVTLGLFDDTTGT